MHKRYSVVTVVDDEGKSLEDGKKLPNEEAEIISFFKGLEREKGEEVRVVLEAGPSSMWLCDLLDDYGIENLLCHPLKTKAIASARIKTDRLDSEILAQLLRTDFIPQAYKPDQRTRSLRELLRYRSFLMGKRTAVKISINVFLARRNLRVPSGNPCRGEDILLLSGLELPPSCGFILDGYLRALLFPSEEIKRAEQQIRERFRESEEAKLLSTLPGVGGILSLLILSEIGDIGRLQSAKHLSSHAGLCPSTHQSGKTLRHGRITRQGSKWLRFALVEAAIHAVRKPGPIREHYLRIERKKGSKVARVATARKMATYIYQAQREKGLQGTSAFAFEQMRHGVSPPGNRAKEGRINLFGSPGSQNYFAPHRRARTDV